VWQREDIASGLAQASLSTRATPVVTLSPSPASRGLKLQRHFAALPCRQKNPANWRDEKEVGIGQILQHRLLLVLLRINTPSHVQAKGSVKILMWQMPPHLACSALVVLITPVLPGSVNNNRLTHYGAIFSGRA
jgi:hypothetical protein